MRILGPEEISTSNATSTLERVSRQHVTKDVYSTFKPKIVSQDQTQQTTLTVYLQVCKYVTNNSVFEHDNKGNIVN